MDSTADVPDEELYSSAAFALKQIANGAATGSVWRLRFRAFIERKFGSLGAVLGRRPWLAIGLVFLVCVGLGLGLLKAKFETDVNELWVEQGGRLEDEIDYTDAVLGEGAQASAELVIQVGRDGSDATTPEALLEHLAVVTRVAQNVSITQWGREWRYQDVCYFNNPPETVFYPILDTLLRAMNPCTVPTVLDCFWEGSLVHDRETPYHFSVPGSTYDKDISWSNLDVNEIVDALKNGTPPLDPVVEVELRKISAYFNKPCLNPLDPRCPVTAPNKGQATVNVTEALLAGCTSLGYAWASDIIISGDDWSKGGGSPAVQAILNLRSEQDVLKKISEEQIRYPSSVLAQQGNLTLGDADGLLRKWRKEFVKAVYDTEESFTHTDAHAWTSNSAQQVLEDFSSGNEVLLIIGYCLMAAYAGMAFVNLRSAVRSRVNVGLAGVVFVVFACLAGLGFSALCGIKFNPTTTQVLPFLVLGLGVDDMFVLAHTYFHIFDDAKSKDLPLSEISRRCLEKVGHSVTLTSVTNGAGFFLAAIIPIPAMRDFALQVGICVVFNYFVLLFAFPAYLCLDGGRVRLGMWDILCFGRKTPQCLCNGETMVAREVLDEESTDAKKSDDSGMLSSKPKEKSSRCDSIGQNWGDVFVQKFYAPLLCNPIAKVVVIVIAAGLLGVCIYGATRVENGLDLTEVVPSNTRQHDFVVANAKYFSYAYITIVQDEHNNFGSVEWQKETLDFHHSLADIQWIVKSTRTRQGQELRTVSEPFWLEKMIDFYNGVQRLYDYEVAINSVTAYSMLLRYYLIPQLGNGSVDMSLLLDPARRFVEDSNGTIVIPEDRFYVYLTAWVSLDLVFPQTTNPNFRPVPPSWKISPAPTNNYIPPAGPLRYAGMNMYANKLKTSSEQIELIKQTRNLIAKAKDSGVSSYPRGAPFTFYEQYIGLQKQLGLAIGLILLACLLATSILLLSLWTGFIMIFMLGLTAVEVYGFVGLANIQFSAIPCVSVIVSVGAAVEFTAPLCLMFVKIAGTRDRRVHYALLYRFVPIFNGAVSTFLGFIMLAFSEFEFIVRYFLLIFIALLVAGTFNGLVVLPVILSLIGPPPQVVPCKGDTPEKVKLDTKKDLSKEVKGNGPEMSTDVLY